LIDEATQKDELRRQLRRRRAAISPAARRHAARRVLLQLLRSGLLRGPVIGVYLSMTSELQTTLLILTLRRCGYALAAPVVQGPGRMAFAQLPRTHRSRRGAHGAPVAASPHRHVPRSRIGTLLVPLVGVDRDGYRLGAGGGYYDRWLAPRPGLRRPVTIGLAYRFQRVDRVPRAPWDARLDAVCDETRTTRHHLPPSPTEEPCPTG